jgi:uncharacterized protein YndB with AHSA1/START domain
MRWLFWNRRHHVEVQRSFAVRPKTLWRHLHEAGWLDGEANWQPGTSFLLWDGTRIKVQTVRPPHELSFHWIPPVGERTDVRATIHFQPNGRTSLTFRQEGIPKSNDLGNYRQRWLKALDSIEEGLRLHR